MPSDDVILNLRQIAGYPPADAQAQDAILLQRGGLGGPYMYVAADDLVAKALAYYTAPLSVGYAAPADAKPDQVFCAGTVTALSGWWMWNAYLDVGGVARSLQGGSSAAFTFDATDGFLFQTAQGVAAGSPIAWTYPFNIDWNGYVSANQMAVKRDPQSPLEVVTLQYLHSAAVASVSGRHGDVTLTVQDVMGALPAFNPRMGGRATVNGDLVATASYVRSAIGSALSATPLVTSFNGRTGPILLSPQDVAAAGGLSNPSPALTGVPTSVTPPPADNSTAIATTAWVAAEIAGTGAQFAPINSPVFTGFPQGPTAPIGTSTGQLATTAYVMNAVSEATAGVATWNGRSGNVTMDLADIEAAGGAPLNAPAFTGVATAATASVGANSTQIATTAYVLAAIAALGGVVSTFNGRTGTVTLSSADLTGAGGALLSSPPFTGTPTAPTPPTSDASNTLATTTFVHNVIASDAVLSFNGRQGAVSLTAADVNAAGGLANPSPSLTGVPLAPTATAGTNSTQIATTAFVAAAIAAAATGYLPLTGGALTGALTGTTANFVGSSATLPGLSLNGSGATPWTGAAVPTDATIIVNKTASGNQSRIFGADNGVFRWVVNLGDSTAESGANAGSNFSIGNYADAGGAVLGSPLAIVRSTGAVSIFGSPSGDNASAGYVGEILITIVTTAVTVASGTVINVGSLAITAGDWDIFGELWLTTPTGTTVIGGAVTTASGAFPSAPATNAARAQAVFGQSTVGGINCLTMACRSTGAVSATFFLVASATYASGTATAIGKIWARRRR